MENRKLIISLKKGNEASFKEVYLNYYDKLIHIAKRFDFKVLTVSEIDVNLYVSMVN